MTLSGGFVLGIQEYDKTNNGTIKFNAASPHKPNLM
jgi:hypothetical protein